MLQLHRLARALALVLVLVPLALSKAGAQLKLPQKPAQATPDKPKGNTAPHIDCLVCGARSYTYSLDGRKDEAGHDVVWCETCKRDTAHGSSVNSELGLTPSKTGAKNAGDLKLPKPKSQAPAAPVKPTVAPPSADPATDPTAKDATPKDAPRDATTPGGATPAQNAATFVFNEVRKAKSLDEGLLPKAVDTLLSAKESGVATARKELFSEEAPVVVVATRVLLHGGADEDVELVKSRMRLKLSAAAAQPVLDELLKRDPVRVGPSFLVELLDHPAGSTRQVAERALKKHPTAELLPLLEHSRASKRADTRLATVTIAAEIDDPRATAMLLRMIDDPASKVAAAAVGTLSTRADPGLDQELIGIAFRDRWVLRRSAFALIAVMEREDLHLAPILDAPHVEPLLATLDSSDSFLAGTAAAALAGIGFRARGAESPEWLDVAVMDHLVLTMSGKEFHDDMGALTPAALRRLRLLSGQSIANDGPRWVDWWVKSRQGFHARRAQLVISAGEIGAVAVRCEVTGETAGVFTLVAPEIGRAAETSIDSGEIVYLTEKEMQSVVAVLQREGVLSGEHLPGLRGAHGPGERSLDVSVKGRAKSFTLGVGVSEPWFEHALDACRALRDRNRWQHFPDVARHASSFQLWQEQSQWWAAEHTAAERAARMKTLAFAAMKSGAPALREPAVAELERLAKESGSADPTDFQPLLQVLRRETAHGDRARRVARMALASARAAGSEGRTPDELALELAQVSCTIFGTNAGEVLAEEFSTSSHEFVRKMALDARPLLRGVAARTLAKNPSAEDVAILIRLLDDPDATVQTAAASALGENKIEEARLELLSRARVGQTPVRIAALEAIGKLGGQYVLEALTLGVTDRDPAVRLAASRGIAALHDPAGAQVLITILSEPGDAELFDAARTGLALMGRAAHDDLIRAVNSPSAFSRREAALILSEQCVADAASPLMSILSANPKDTRVASELAILTCVDMRTQHDPSAGWWGWWDGVRHDDAMAWFRAALERAGAAPPPPGAIEGDGTVQGRLFLLAVMGRSEPVLVERAQREFARLVGKDVTALPPIGLERDAWMRAWREKLGERNAGG